MAEIAFHNVTKRYKDILAVDDASFTVADNEFFCFFGPPLSGKSTILRLILGLEKPDSGEILIDGKVVNGVSPAARNMWREFGSWSRPGASRSLAEGSPSRSSR